MSIDFSVLNQNLPKTRRQTELPLVTKNAGGRRLSAGQTVALGLFNEVRLIRDSESPYVIEQLKFIMPEGIEVSYVSDRLAKVIININTARISVRAALQLGIFVTYKLSLVPHPGLIIMFRCLGKSDKINR